VTKEPTPPMRWAIVIFLFFGVVSGVGSWFIISPDPTKDFVRVCLGILLESLSVMLCALAGYMAAKSEG
jgi:hypothetical protein